MRDHRDGRIENPIFHPVQGPPLPEGQVVVFPVAPRPEWFAAGHPWLGKQSGLGARTRLDGGL